MENKDLVDLSTNSMAQSVYTIRRQMYALKALTSPVIMSANLF